MSAAAILLLESLGRTTLWLAAAGVLAAVLLRLVRSEWPTAHRVAWLLVLAIGWTFLRLPLAVPWYDAELGEPSEVEVAAVETTLAAAPVIDLAPAAGERALSSPVVDLAAADSLPGEATSIAPVAVDASPEVANAAEPSDGADHSSAAAAPSGRPFYESIDWPGVVVAGWILGMSLGAGLWLVGYVRFVRLLRERQPADDASQAAWRGLLADAGVKRSIPLSVSEQFGPMLCCLPGGYELIVPAELWSELDGAGQGAILRHELAHYQRGDVWKSLVVRLLALPHWFNPVAWLAVRRFEEAAEWACDRAAVADEPATEYAKLLVQLGQSPHALGYGSAARGRPLAGRVRRVLAGKEPKDSAVKTLLLLVVAVAMVAISVVQLELIAKEPAANVKDQPAKSTEQDEASGLGTNETTPPAGPAEPTAAGVSDSQAVTDRIADETAYEAQLMIVKAERAYTTHLAAYFAQTAAMTPVYDWSLRWMQASEAAAKSQAQLVAAARAHVDRMSQLQKKTRLINDGGGRGGASADAAAADFYLAQAKRHLAEVEAQPAAAVDAGTSTTTAAPVEPTEPVDLRELAEAKIGKAAGPDALQEEMLKQAARAYQASQAAFDAQTAPMSSIYNWSLRWMQVGESAAKNQAERISAARDHVERMRQLQSRTELLYQIGKRGGEAADYAAANFYLAEAKRHLAEVEAQPAARAERSVNAVSVDHALQAVDLEIKLAELRGDYEQSQIALTTAENSATKLRLILRSQPGAISETELTRAEGEAAGSKVKLATLKQQIALHEKKLALLKGQPQQTGQGAGAAQLPFGDVRESRPELHYAGKDFDAWRSILLNDLDPATRAEAVRALAAFANHGYGKAAAEAIVEVFKDLKPVPYDGGPTGILRERALHAFARFNDGTMMMIPEKDALPVILRAMQSEIADQRLFALLALQNWSDNEKLVLPLTVKALSDPASEVRRNAAIYLVKSHPDTPGLLEVMREWLSPEEDRLTSQMAIVTLNQAAPQLQAKLAPELVRLLDRENQWAVVGGKGGMGGMEVEIGNAQNAGPLLLRIGAAAIPALEKGAESDHEVVRRRSKELLENMKKAPSDDKPSEQKR